MSVVIADGRCLRARRSVSAAIDQEAAAGELGSAALHLARCSECRRFFVGIDAVSSLLRGTELAPRNGSSGG
jgi:predicted anti-sigma-YlaC factor YlaD